MSPVRFRYLPDSMAGTLFDAPGFPGEEFPVGFPEAVGDWARPAWYGGLRPTWSAPDPAAPDEAARCQARVEGELEYRMIVRAGEDFAEFEIELTNLSDRAWGRGMAFNCVKGGDAPSFKDHDCLRHRVRVVEPDGSRRLARLAELPRRFGPRPALQLYDVEGAPPARENPFVAGFGATPDRVLLEGWIGIESRDGRGLLSVSSRPALFLFQNREYGCIHAAADFGPMEPGATSRATTRVEFARTPPDPPRDD